MFVTASSLGRGRSNSRNGATLTRSSLGILALVVILGTPRSALAQECWKWNNELSFCPAEGGLAPAAWCNGGTLLPITPKQEAILWSRLYADTPEEALEEWASYGYPGNEGTPTLEQISPTQIWVWFDDGDGVRGTGGDEHANILDYVPVVRESCCEEEANIKGYHQLEPDVWYKQDGGVGSAVEEMAPEAGGKFTWGEPLFDAGIPMEFPSQVDLIRAPNRRKHTKDKYASDFLRPGAEGLLKLEPFLGDLDNTFHRRWPYGPQIDHIIPRIDKFGCKCGSNSSNNAQVISAKLNNELSNNCSDPRRIEIIEHYKKRKLGIIPIQIDQGWDPGAQNSVVQESTANSDSYAPSALTAALLQAYDALFPTLLKWWNICALDQGSR